MDESAIRAITRPHKSLLTMYFLQALVTLIAFPFVFVPLYFKYHTLKYKFDDEGISASWGVIFRHEIYLTYRRIQDIHVNRNLFERWLGIGRVELQTASGSSSAELSLEGMEQYEAVRDFLYGRMRGTGAGAATSDPSAEGSATGESDEAVVLLRAIKEDIEGVRSALETGGREG
jgi:uncharacterized membrane protein YdbT with pleckstrin-like domain